MVRNILGVAYARSGAYDAAIEQFEAAIAMDPGAESFRKNLENARGMKTRTARPSGAPGRPRSGE